MNFNDLVKFVASFEGFVDHVYKCPAGVKTIGFGFTDKESIAMGKMSYEDACDILSDKLLKLYMRIKNQMSKWGYGCTENQLYALTSFCYNGGYGWLKQVTNDGTRSLDVIAQKMLLYNKANGKVLSGLVRRRKAEVELFNKKPVNLSNTPSNVSVSYMQSLLYELGYDVAIDNIFGNKTLTACICALERLKA